MDKNFNVIISGIGGQGVITILMIIVEAALIEGSDVRSSELHGLSQRGGGVLAHIRFGKKVYSPMVSYGRADLVIGLEMVEGLRSVNYINEKTNILINKYFLPISKKINKEQTIKELEKIKNINFIDANKICKEKFSKEVLAGIYMLGVAINRKLIPIKKESILKAIENIIPKKYKELNIKVFKSTYDK